jgi:hypothetical protein
MKYSLLLSVLFFSHLSFAQSSPGKWSEILETDETCEIKASIWKLENSSTALFELIESGESKFRPLSLTIMNTEREIYHSVDQRLPSLELRMTFEYENSLPLLSVFYSGRYFRCSMNHKSSDKSLNVGSIGH